MTLDQIRRAKAQIFIYQALGLGFDSPNIDGDPCYVSFNDQRVVVIVPREESASRLPAIAHLRPVEVVWFNYSRVGARLASAVHDVSDPDTKLACWVHYKAAPSPRIVSGSYTLSELAALSRQSDVTKLDISGTSAPK